MRKGKSICSVIVLFITTVFMSACLETDPGFDEYGQWIKDVAAIDAYVDANDISVIKDAASGISIHITEMGTAGLPPDLDNDIKVKYTGKFFTGGTFEGPNEIIVKLRNMIEGWKIALPMLPAGTKATLYIPSYYAYGNRGQGSIPSNTSLIFDIELITVQRIPEQVSKFTSDTTAITLFLEDSTNFVRYDSGIWYKVTQEGPGSITPTSIYQQVKIRYTVKEMATGGVTYYDNLMIEPIPNFSSRLVNFPQGVMIGLQEMTEGEKRIFYIPSALGYGSRGQATSGSGIPLPANANLIFEIELIDVVN